MMSGIGTTSPLEDEMVVRGVPVSDDSGEFALPNVVAESPRCGWAELSCWTVVVVAATGALTGAVGPGAKERLDSERTGLELLAVFVSSTNPKSSVFEPTESRFSGFIVAEIDRCAVSVSLEAVAVSDTVGPLELEASDFGTSEFEIEETSPGLSPVVSAVFVCCGKLLNNAAVVSVPIGSDALDLESVRIDSSGMIDFAGKIGEVVMLPISEILVNSAVVRSEMEIAEGDDACSEVERTTVFAPSIAKLISVAFGCIPEA